MCFKQEEDQKVLQKALEEAKQEGIISEAEFKEAKENGAIPG